MHTHESEDVGIQEKRQMIEESYQKLLHTKPMVKDIPEYRPTLAPYTHTRAITYEGLERHGLRTKVFAYVSYPDGASQDQPVPGVVLVHGGGGHAFLEWMHLWNQHGYAAIAMDTTGFFPVAVNAGDTEVTQGYGYGLSGLFDEQGYTNAPDNDGMSSSDGSIEDMWMYHAIGQVILAHNVLRADPLVDTQRIGVTGISWGGVITSLLIGWDSRFAFAIPVYGSAHLDEARSWMGKNFSGAATQALWSAAARREQWTMPVLWLAWNDDNCFSINSHSKSYLDVADGLPQTRLSIRDKMMHSHGCAWLVPESYVFADSIVKGVPHMPGLAAQPSGRSLHVPLVAETGVKVDSVRLYYITAPQTYSRHEKYGYTDTFMDQTWQTLDLTYQTDHEGSGYITGRVPDEAAAYYIQIISEVGSQPVVTSSIFVEL